MLYTSPHFVEEYARLGQAHVHPGYWPSSPERRRVLQDKRPGGHLPLGDWLPTIEALYYVGGSLLQLWYNITPKPILIIKAPYNIGGDSS